MDDKQIMSNGMQCELDAAASRHRQDLLSATQKLPKAFPQGPLTQETIDMLAVCPQDSLYKTQQIISNIMRLQNSNDIVGLVASAIRSNVNTAYRLSYADFGEKPPPRHKKAKQIVDDFNEAVNIKSIIRDSITETYCQGTYIMYLRSVGDKYIVDRYPLGVAVIAPYLYEGEPVVLIDTQELMSRFMSITQDDASIDIYAWEEDIKKFYPKEVSDAIKAKKRFAMLDPRFTGVIRVDHRGLRYGLSPIFRALGDIIMLDNFSRADKATSRVKAKKILFQKMREKLLGETGDKRAYEEMAYSHGELCKAVTQDVALYTGMPWVEDVEFVKFEDTMTDPATVNYYRNKALTTLGIGYYYSDDKAHGLSTSRLHLTQLLRTIDSIANGLESIIKRWYIQILENKSIPKEFAPSIDVINSEMLDMDIRKDLATTLYTMFNASMKTSLDMIGIDVDDEAARRRTENNSDFEKIFAPRQTAYTSSPAGDGGRPPGKEETDKQQYDRLRNEENPE